MSLWSIGRSDSSWRLQAGSEQVLFRGQEYRHIIRVRPPLRRTLLSTEVDQRHIIRVRPPLRRTRFTTEV
ncbi:hypothetical protein ACFU5O_27710, partial [Streptomyces sp. NPDC057445]|uniref:hypothetical protein n=1 Tax=Streptomyces sp. NPDC057445 TaxID=3346136 RepID=UPI0036B2B4E7